MKVVMELLLKYKYLFLVVIFSVVASFSLLHSGLPPTHDGEYHVVRFWQFDKVLRDGDLYPRWAPDLNFGLGIPLFSYIYPLPNYVASFLHTFGVSFIDAFKLNLFFAIIMAGIFFYLWTKNFFGSLGAMVGTVFYLFSPYLFVDVYIRGSVGEVWALAFFPGFLWAITELILNDNKKFLPVSILFLSLVIFSHNILALLFFPFAITYSFILILISKEKRNKIINLVKVVLISLGLSSIFWLPAILETKYTMGLQIYDFRTNFPDLYQLIFPSWGSGFFGGGIQNEMSVQIGIANLMGVLLSFFVLYKLVKKKDFRKTIVTFFILSFFIVLFLMQDISLILWEKIPLMNYFQFPWRFLSLTILICSFLAASIFSVFKSKFFSLFLVIFAVLLTYNYAHPAYYLEREDSYYQTRSNFIDGTNSIGNVFNTIWIKGDFIREKDIVDSLDKNIKIDKREIKSTKYKFNTSSDVNFPLILNTAYFPGWVAKIDGKRVNTSANKKGLITFNVPKGDHKVEVSFSDTSIRTLSLAISLIAFVLVIKLFFQNWYIRYK
ncbi:MAG: hypothetical protein ACD_31C00017G0002 [uncultured bacterium]|nr:MAG: hypothetical protein ACD_31C00017G0002 [uncultured bacterium]